MRSLYRRVIANTVLAAIFVLVANNEALHAHSIGRHPQKKPSGSQGYSSPLQAAVARLTPSVVIVHASDGKGGIELGTGFCVRRDGWITTAAHIVAGGDVWVGVREQNGYNAYPAQVVVQDVADDIALLKIKAIAPAVQLVPSPRTAGANAATIGFPFGPTPKGVFAPSVSLGIVGSVQPNSAEQGDNTLAVNLLLAHGSSGSPVFLPSSGDVIGMILQRMEERDGNAIPVGLAITSERIQQLFHKALSEHRPHVASAH